MADSWGPTSPIHTARLILRPHSDSDLADLLRFHSDPEVVRYTPWPVRDEAQSRETLAAKIPRGMPDENEAWLVLAIVHDDRVVGEVLLKREPDDHRLGEIGFAIAQDAWGKGIAREAAHAMLAFAFDELHMHRVTAVCDERNEASWRLLRTLGMRREAHNVEASWFKDEWCSVFEYALLAREWAARESTQS